MGWQDWRPWPTSKRSDKDNEATPFSTDALSKSLEEVRNATSTSGLTFTQTAIACIFTSAATLGFLRIYKTYVRRIPNVEHLKPSLLRKRSIYGYVTSVGDGDNFRLFHTPGGKLLGWGWLPGRMPQTLKKLQDQTVHVRIAGVDAPELAHFGRPAQPYGQEALDWLRSQILHRYVRVYPYRRDQYDRVVCTVFRRRFLFFKADVGHGMLKNGLATVYEAKFGSEFGGKEAQYKKTEKHAKQRQIGMWQKPTLVDKVLMRKVEKFESPREYKTRMTESEKSGGTK